MARQSDTAAQLDRIIHSVMAGLQETPRYFYDPALGLIGTVAAIVERECREEGLRVSRRTVLDRCSDFAFGEGDEETCSVN
jgi:hypothetical protein